jgi:hypothetical protein
VAVIAAKAGISIGNGIGGGGGTAEIKRRLATAQGNGVLAKIGVAIWREKYQRRMAVAAAAGVAKAIRHRNGGLAAIPAGENVKIPSSKRQLESGNNQPLASRKKAGLCLRSKSQRRQLAAAKWPWQYCGESWPAINQRRNGVIISQHPRRLRRGGENIGNQ